MQKVADASGSKYSGGTAPTTAPGPKPPVSSKPAFTPTQSTSAFKPLGATRAPAKRDENVDEDGWGQDAPPVYRTQLEKVQPAYQPTRVNMAELTSQKPTQSQFSSSRNEPEREDVVKGGYQPIGKVDIAAIRAQAKSTSDDRPTTVKGSYEPVGKVDIAAIRAKAQPPVSGRTPPSSISPAATGGSGGDDPPRSLADRSAAFSTSERLTSLPKPKVSNKFGGGATFTGTKAPTPGGFEAKPLAGAAPVGTASRTFADQDGKTPAQLWAEKKARERGMSGSENAPSSMGYGGPTSPIASQTSGGGEWKSGYAGKSWAPVQTTHTGKSASSLGQQNTGPQEEIEEEAPTSPAGGIGSIRDRFKEAPPMGAPSTSFDRSAPEPPPLDTYSKPNAGRGIPIPGMAAQQHSYDEEEEHPSMPTPPPQPPRSPTPPTPEMRSSSPIRVAMPVGRGAPDISDAREEQMSPPTAMPTKSLADTIPHERDLDDEPQHSGRGAAQAAAAATFGAGAAAAGAHAAQAGGKRAIVQYDYDKAEDNEVELKEGEYVTNIDMVDDDWWMGENSRGETGLFPSNYVELVEDGAGGTAGHAAPPPAEEEHAPPPGPPPTKGGPTATAQYDYEAAEDNEISFPEGAKITSLVRYSFHISLRLNC
jgi:drebrin-like protein